jgi:hypothetical protein
MRCNKTHMERAEDAVLWWSAQLDSITRSYLEGEKYSQHWVAVYFGSTFSVFDFQIIKYQSIDRMKEIPPQHTDTT